MKAFLDEAIERQEKHLVCTETVDKGHGRVEVRRYWQTEKLEWFADQSAWEGLRSVGAVESRRTLRGKESVERRYYLSSLGSDAEKFARAVRGHWGVENTLALGAGRDLWRGPEPRPHRLRRGEPRADPAAGDQPPAAGQNLQARHQRQTPAGRH